MSIERRVAPWDPKTALAQMHRVAGVDASPERRTVNPLLLKFLHQFLPGLRTDTVEIAANVNNNRQTDKGGVRTEGAFLFQGDLIRDKGIGIHVVGSFNHTVAATLSPWEQERIGAMEGPLALGSNLELQFYTPEKWAETLAYLKKLYGGIFMGIGAHKIDLPLIARHHHLGTSSINVDAGWNGCRVDVSHYDRENPNGSALIAPVVEGIAKRLRTAVDSKKYLPAYEKAKVVFGQYHTAERARIASVEAKKQRPALPPKNT